MVRDPLERQVGHSVLLGIFNLDSDEVSWYCFLRQLLTAVKDRTTPLAAAYSNRMHWCERIKLSHPHFLEAEPDACKGIHHVTNNNKAPVQSDEIQSIDQTSSNTANVTAGSQVLAFEASKESFRKFVLSSREDKLDNYQTRAFAGCLPNSLVEDKPMPVECSDPQAMLVLAKKNLDGFLYVGVTERYEDASKLLEHTFRFSGVCYSWERPRHLPTPVSKRTGKPVETVRPQPGMRSSRGRRMVRNMTHRKEDCTDALLVPLPDEEDMPDDDTELDDQYEKEVMDIVHEVDGLDFAIYDYAVELFKRRMVRMQRELDYGN